MSILNSKEIPVGLGMALAQNLDAMEVFSAMNDFQKRSVIERCHNVKSKKDMQALVDSLTL